MWKIFKKTNKLIVEEPPLIWKPINNKRDQPFTFYICFVWDQSESNWNWCIHKTNIHILDSKYERSLQMLSQQDSLNTHQWKVITDISVFPKSFRKNLNLEKIVMNERGEISLPNIFIAELDFFWHNFRLNYSNDFSNLPFIACTIKTACRRLRKYH